MVASSVAQGSDQYAWAGLRLEGRRFLGQEPATVNHCPNLLERGRWKHDSNGVGSTDGEEGFLQRVTVADTSGAAGQRRQDAVVETVDRGRAPIAQSERRPCPAIRDHGNSVGESVKRGLTVAHHIGALKHCGCAADGVQRDAVEDAMDGSEVEGSGVLVDEHREPMVRCAARMPGLEPQIGGVTVMAVGEQGPVRRERGGRLCELRCLADRPDPMPLSEFVGEFVLRRLALRRVDDRREAVAVLSEEQDGRRVEGGGVHAVGEIVGLRQMDTLMGKDDALAAIKGAFGDVEPADESTHGEAESGVLVHVERGSAVGPESPAPPPGADSLRGRSQRARVQPGAGWVADVPGAEHERSERGESQRPGDIWRRYYRAAVHPTIVGCTRARGDPVLQESRQPLNDAHDLAMLDLDGVVYVGGDAVPGAVQALAAARSAGTRLAFITNNAARTPGTVAAHLVELGVDARAADVVTSAQAAARLLAERLGAGGRVAALGAEGLLSALREQGLSPVAVEEEADALATGYGPDVVWRDIMRAAVRVRDGLWWVASNTDGTIPTPYGEAPGHGVLVDLLRRFSGVDPVVAGKPARPLFEETIRRVGGEHPLLVGDRLDTDIRGARAAGIPSLLVLTGVTGLPELVGAGADERPTYVAEDLRGLGEAHPVPTLSRGAAELGGWRGDVVDGALVIGGAGSPGDWWRVVASTAWAYRDASGSVARVGDLAAPTGRLAP